MRAFSVSGRVACLSFCILFFLLLLSVMSSQQAGASRAGDAALEDALALLLAGEVGAAEKALQDLRAAGNPEASYALGHLYLLPRFEYRYLDKAEKIFADLHRAGFKKAIAGIFAVKRIKKEEPFFPSEVKESLALAEDLAASDFADAYPFSYTYAGLVNLWHDGGYTERAVDYFEKASGLGEAEATDQLARYCDEGGRLRGDKDCRQIIELAARRGGAFGLFRSGLALTQSAPEPSDDLRQIDDTWGEGAGRIFLSLYFHEDPEAERFFVMSTERWGQDIIRAADAFAQVWMAENINEPSAPLYKIYEFCAGLPDSPFKADRNRVICRDYIFADHAACDFQALFGARDFLHSQLYRQCREGRVEARKQP